MVHDFKIRDFNNYMIDNASVEIQTIRRWLHGAIDILSARLIGCWVMLSDLCNIYS